MTLKPRNFLEIARAAARSCDDKKALDVRLLDVHRLSGLTDYYVLATADSSVQLQAVEDHVDKTIKQEFGLNPIHQEGRAGAQWLVVDYGGLVVHLMHRSAREFYDLERLWEGARPVDWAREEPAPVPAKKKVSRKKAPARTR